MSARHTLALTLGPLALAAVMAGCVAPGQTSPNGPARTVGTPPSSPSASSTAAVAAPCATVGADQVAVTKAAGIAVYELSDGTQVAQDPTAPLCATVLADMQRRLWADPETAFHAIPSTERGTQFIDNNAAYAAKFSSATGKSITIVFPYIGACGGATLTAPGWAHTPVSADPTKQDRIDCQVTATAAEMTDQLKTLISTLPDSPKFAVVVRLDPDFVLPEPGATVAAAEVAAVAPAGGHVYVSPTGDGSGVVVAPNQPLPTAVLDDLKTSPISLTNSSQCPVSDGAYLAVVQAIHDSGIPAFYPLVTPRSMGAIVGGGCSWWIGEMNSPEIAQWLKARWNPDTHGYDGFGNRQSTTFAAAMASEKAMLDAFPDIPVVVPVITSR